MKAIHFGSKEFKPEKFQAIKNQDWINKPLGGLWLSPIDTEFGWQNWCEESGFRECSYEESFTLD